MHLIRLGSRYLNLSYMILAEEWDAPPVGPQVGPGCLRVTVETGRIIDLGPPDADKLRRRLDAMCEDDGASATGPVGKAAVHVARSAEPPKARRRKKRG